MRFENVTKRDALIKAKAMVGISSFYKPIPIIISSYGRDAVNQTEDLSQIANDEPGRTAILTKYYQSTIHSMQRSTQGKAYTQKRGLDANPEASGSIGFCAYDICKSWNKELQENAEKLGLFKIKNCIIFPLKDRDGHIVSIYGRSISDTNTSKHYYLAGGFKGLYPSYPKADTTKLILVESIIDAATFRQHFDRLSVSAQGAASGYEVLALYGTNGFTSEHVEAIKEWSNTSAEIPTASVGKQVIKNIESIKEIILFFDGDEAGRAANEKYSKLIHEMRSDIKISYVTTPESEDPNSLIQSHEPEILQHLINERNFFFSLPDFSFSIENKNGQAGTENSDPASSAGRENKSENIEPIETSKNHKPIHGSAIQGSINKGALDTHNPELITYHTEHLHILILGGIKISGLDRMRVTLKIERSTYSHHLPVRHSLDLYHTKQVEQLTQKIAESLELGTAESERTISKLTNALEHYRQSKLELLKPKKEERKELSDKERSEAIAYLKDPKLLRNTLNDITKSGIVGESNNALIAYLAYTSRKREKPLHIICLGASGTGKTYLQEKVNELIPEEDKIEITSLSDNAFYYFGREELKHKLILIEDLDGAENVLYPLRELQSKRKISKTVTLKDNKGNLKTITLQVEGPVCVSGCTTKERVYDDNANRCILLYIDDSSDHDHRIMEYQQRGSAGQIDVIEESQIREKIKNVQRILSPIKVINPYAELIDLPQEVFKPRRTLLLLLSFIETITFYHQYQREVIDDTIFTTKEDIKAAFSLLKEVLFSKSDELSKACRNFLERLKERTKVGETFYAQALRKSQRMGSSTLHRYLIELSRNGYIKIKSGSKFKGFEYEVCDYEEYLRLRSSIDDKIKLIMHKIDHYKPSEMRTPSVPVSHQYPTSTNGILTA